MLWQRLVWVVMSVLFGGCGFNAANPMIDAMETESLTVGFAATETMADEASMTVMVAVSLSAAPAQTVTVSYGITGGSATRDVDFVAADGMLTFGPGQQTQSIAVMIRTDFDEEDSETIELALSAPVGAMLGTSSHTITISPSVLPRVQFTTTSSQTAEPAQPTIELTLSFAVAAEVTVQVSVGGTASTADHALADGTTITFPANTTTQLIPLGVIDDALDEDDETVELGLKSPSAGLLIGKNGSRTHTIADNDAPPMISLAAASSDGEAIASSNIAVNLSAPSGKMITVAYARTGGTATAADATVAGAPGTLTFMPGQMQQPIPVLITGDTLDEDDETVEVTLSGATNATLGTAVHTLTIIDDDLPPSVAFALATSQSGEGDGMVTLTVSLSALSGRMISVPFGVANSATTATDGVDYDIKTATPLTFMPGTQNLLIAIELIQDALVEPDETIGFTLGTPTAATLGTITTHALTIVNDD